MEPRKSKIGELIGEYQPRSIVLPEFQRPYSWEALQIATFWSDLNDFEGRFEKDPVKASYFLGPVVLIEKESSNEILVLDGQQRLATATIMLAALRDVATVALKSHVSDKNIDYFARDIQRELIEKKDSNPVTYALTLGDMDEPFFLGTIKSSPASAIKPTMRSHTLIKAAYDYFVEKLTARIEGQSAEKTLSILKLSRDSLIKGMSLIVIAVKDEDNAYDIFETLNDRGLRLSVPDLVANLLLKRCKTAAEKKVVRHQWQSMTQQMGRRDTSKFIRHFWLSRHGDLKSKGLYSEIKSQLNAQKITSQTFAKECAESCDFYVELLEAQASLPKSARHNVEGLVKYLGVHNSLPALLAARECLGDGDFTKLVKTITTIFIRHTLVANQNPLDFETALYKVAQSIRAAKAAKKSSATIMAAAKQHITPLDQPDATVEAKAADLILTKSAAAWLLARIASSAQSKTKEVGMDDANVEHIFPQNADSSWSDKDALEPYIWSIGNLTILGKRLNQKAQNKSFQEKCKEHYSKSEIELTKSLLKHTGEWNVAAIKARGKVLGKLIVQTWRL